MMVTNETTAGHTPTRSERKKLDKLRRIVEAAEELFRTQGFDATSARQICERADIGTGTLFLYVSDKRELLTLLFEPRARAALRAIEPEPQPGEHLADAMSRLAQGLFAMYAADEALARLFVQDLLFREPSDTLRALSDELTQRVRHLVVSAQERHEIRTDPGTDVIVAGLLAHYTLWLQLWLSTPDLSLEVASDRLRAALRLQCEGIDVRGPAT